MAKKVGIAGLGIIGSAVNKLFPSAHVYDPARECNDDKALDDCDVIFICVPTPMKGDPPGSEGLDMSIVEDVVGRYTHGNQSPLFVICSALQPGTADRLMDKEVCRIVVQPEYFGETQGHPLTDLKAQPFLILGGASEDVDEVIELYQTVYPASVSIRKVTALEAEVIKLSENRAIMFKVMQCQELYDTCKAAGVDYNVVREAVYGDDPRFNLWFTAVYPDSRGCTSKCIPKDIYGWAYWAKTRMRSPYLTECLLDYNNVMVSEENW